MSDGTRVAPREHVVRIVVVVLVLACVGCEESAGPASAWTYEVTGTAQVAGAGSPSAFAATLLVTVSPFSDGDDADDGVPQSIGWSDLCAVDVSVQDQNTDVPDACGYLYQVLVSRTGTITSSTLPACALPPGTATADLALDTSTVTFSPDSQAMQLSLQAGGGGQPAITYTFSSDAAIPPPPAPGSAPCQDTCDR